MSIVARIETGPHRVHYMTCEGIDCETEISLDAYDDDTADRRRRWHSLVDELAAGPRIRHDFCSWGCAASWAIARSASSAPAPAE